MRLREKARVPWISLQILPADKPSILQAAAAALRDGDVVVIPTETVYGLAALARVPDAVTKIFEIKGRPADNPLIVHIAHEDQIERVAQDVSETAKKLAHKFWPGPLTLVLPKNDSIPDITTGGLQTVAVRVPNHPIARAIIAASGPLAAPSANRFMSVSPTRIEDIAEEIQAQVEIGIDGGPCQVGIESTVLDCTVDPPRILRPGDVTREDIEKFLKIKLQDDDTDERKGPGQYPRHYAPKTKIALTDHLGPETPGLTFAVPNHNQIQMPRDARAYAERLYHALNQLDAMNVDFAGIECPPDEPEWEAVWDRLKRAVTKV